MAKLTRDTVLACKRAMQQGAPPNFGVEYFSSENYVGLFLEERAANFLRNLSNVFAEEVAKTTGMFDFIHIEKINLDLSS